MGDPRQERLDELGRRIDAARRAAVQDGLLPDDSERTFIDPNPGGPDDVGPTVGANQNVPG